MEELENYLSSSVASSCFPLAKITLQFSRCQLIICTLLQKLLLAGHFSKKSKSQSKLKMLLKAIEQNINERDNIIKCWEKHEMIYFFE